MEQKHESICDTCEGSGFVTVLLNYNALLEPEEPIESSEPCEECGGHGVLFAEESIQRDSEDH